MTEQKRNDKEKFRREYEASGSTRSFEDWYEKWYRSPLPGMNEDGTLNIVGHMENGKPVWLPGKRRVKRPRPGD